MTTQSSLDKIKAISSINLDDIKKKQAAFESSFMDIPASDPWVPLRMKDKDMKLEFSYAAACDVLRLTGKNIFAGELTDDTLKDPEMLIGVLMIGLQTHQPDITKEEVSRLFMLKHRLYYMHAIGKCFEVIQPNFEQLESVLGDIKNLTEKLSELEAGETTAPLPEILPSPISGQVASPSDVLT